MSDLKLICHIDKEPCWPDTMYSDYLPDDSRLNQCKVCKKRWTNYNKLIEESIKSAEQNPDSNIHLIRKEADFTFKNGGFIKWEKSSDDLEDYGILLGVTTTLEDYYYMWINGKQRICYTSCCIGYYDLDEFTEVPDFLSDLSKLWYEKPELVQKLVDDSLKRNESDRLITEINIKI